MSHELERLDAKVQGRPPRHRADPVDFEPTDAQLAGQGIYTEPTDPHDSPSYERNQP
ncbi:hypothetical protein ACQCSX_04200 [Pseudarthrobacter sp. P1]|uniref:hypothetical protein n=1 Tax=Pseudarthrobacter sp. P1 TaxID=3418418 RepID=UPI003CF79025